MERVTPALMPAVVSGRQVVENGGGQAVPFDARAAGDPFTPNRASRRKEARGHSWGHASSKRRPTKAGQKAKRKREAAGRKAARKGK